MGMSAGGSSHGPKAEMNVVPLIDIVLVLLIIFMAATPIAQRAYDMNIPAKAPPSDTPPPASADQMVVRVTQDERILLNKMDTPRGELRARLEERRVGRTKDQRIVFFSADDETNYAFAVGVMDVIKASGFTVGLVTTELQQ